MNCCSPTKPSSAPKDCGNNDHDCHNHTAKNKSASHHSIREEGHLKSNSHSHQHHQKNHNSHSCHDMSSPQMAQEFLRRFFIVTLLLIPLFIFSPLGKKLGFPEFSWRPYAEFGIASLIFYFGLVFLQHARAEIRQREYGMMTLVSIGISAGYLFSVFSTFFPQIGGEFYLEIATLIWVLLFGHFLEAKSSTAAGNALDEVAKLLPSQAHRFTKEGKIENVDLSELKDDDRVLVKPGEKVPADGIILKGEANFNEAHLTGEARPVHKKEGETVIAGAICLDGSVEVKLTRVGESSTIGQIQKLIQQATQTKPRAQRLADRASKWLTFSALLIALTSLIVWSLFLGETFVFAMTLAITVLVIACPHALGLAIPTVTTIATKLAVKNGIFIKDLSKIEIIKDIDYIIFDKTGTLTEGSFKLSKIIDLKSNQTLELTPQSRLKENFQEILQIAASLEQHSSHVIAQAIINEAENRKITLVSADKFENKAGLGIRGQIKNKTYLIGNYRLMEENNLLNNEIKNLYQELSAQGETIIFIAEEKQILALITLNDRIKEEAQEAINKLHQQQIKVALLTGDHQKAAQRVAQQLNIDTVFAEVLPPDKYKHVQQLQDKGFRVMMVGDGVNDAPALTQADIGVAIGAGTDVAVESGDVVLIRSNPLDIIRLLTLARKVYRKMQENLFWALGYNVVALPAAAGLFIPWGVRLTPEVGAFLMSLSSVIVVINALTLLKTKLN